MATRLFPPYPESESLHSADSNFSLDTSFDGMKLAVAHCVRLTSVSPDMASDLDGPAWQAILPGPGEFLPIDASNTTAGMATVPIPPSMNPFVATLGGATEGHRQGTTMSTSTPATSGPPQDAFISSSPSLPLRKPRASHRRPVPTAIHPDAPPLVPHSSHVSRGDVTPCPVASISASCAIPPSKDTTSADEQADASARMGAVPVRTSPCDEDLGVADLLTGVLTPPLNPGISLHRGLSVTTLAPPMARRKRQLSDGGDLPAPPLSGLMDDGDQHTEKAPRFSIRASAAAIRLGGRVSVGGLVDEAQAPLVASSMAVASSLSSPDLLRALITCAAMDEVATGDGALASSLAGTVVPTRQLAPDDMVEVPAFPLPPPRASPLLPPDARAAGVQDGLPTPASSTANPQDPLSFSTSELAFLREDISQFPEGGVEWRAPSSDYRSSYLSARTAADVASTKRAVTLGTGPEHDRLGDPVLPRDAYPLSSPEAVSRASRPPCNGSIWNTPLPNVDPHPPSSPLEKLMDVSDVPSDASPPSPSLLADCPFPSRRCHGPEPGRVDRDIPRVVGGHSPPPQCPPLEPGTESLPETVDDTWQEPALPAEASDQPRYGRLG